MAKSQPLNVQNEPGRKYPPPFRAGAPSLYRFMLYLIGTMRVMLDPISGGKGGKLAPRALARAAWSRMDDPELPASRADMAWPLLPKVIMTRTVPCSPRALAASG